MSKGINQVVLMGRLTRDPEERTTQSGKTIASFSIAVDRPGKDAGTDFFDVVAWEKLGEIVLQYLSKGRACVVQGRLRQESWDDKDSGKKRSKIGITATDVTFIGGKGDDDHNDRSEQADDDENIKVEDFAPEDIDDKPIDLSEIPF